MKPERIKILEKKLMKLFQTSIEIIKEEKENISVDTVNVEAPMEFKDIINVYFKVKFRNEHLFLASFKGDSLNLDFELYKINSDFKEQYVVPINELNDFIKSLKENEKTIDELIEENEYFGACYNYLINKFNKVKFDISVVFESKKRLVKTYKFKHHNELFFTLKMPVDLEGEYSSPSLFEMIQRSTKIPQDNSYKICIKYKKEDSIEINPDTIKKINVKQDSMQSDKFKYKYIFDKANFIGNISSYFSSLEYKLKINIRDELYINPDYLLYNKLTNEEKLKRFNAALINFNKLEIEELDEKFDFKRNILIIENNEKIINKMKIEYEKLSEIILDLERILDKNLFLVCQDNYKRIQNLYNINSLRYQKQLSIYLEQSQIEIGKKLDFTISEKIKKVLD